MNLSSCNLDAFCEIRLKYENVKNKYGWTGQKDYEWAINEEIKAPNLFNLAKAVDLGHLYAYVDEAHKYNHPSMRYLLNDRGTTAPDDNIQHYLFSPFGLELPIQLIAISLHQVNYAAIIGYEELDSADMDKLSGYLKLNDKFPESVIELVTEKLQGKKEEQSNAD